MTPGAGAALLAALAATAAVLDLSHARAEGARRPRRAASLPALVPVLVALGRRVGLRRPAADLEGRVAAAGTPLGLSASDVAAIKGGAALVGGLLALPLAMASGGRAGVLGIAVGTAGGFLAPDAWLRRRARARQLDMARELPDVLDLLRVTVDAGLPVGRALAEVGRRHTGALACELALTATAIDLGVPRAGALAALRRRAPLPAVASLVAAVERTERHGAPLAPALVALAGQARAERGRALAEQAARAAPKIQLAVALLLVPSVLALVAAAAVAALVPH